MQHYLTLAQSLVKQGYPLDAIFCLSAVREMARKGDTQRCRLIAVHCTIAMQALIPQALEQHLAYEDAFHDA